MAMMVCNHANFGDFMWYNHQIRWSLNIIQNLAEPLVNKPPKCCQAFLSAGIIWLRPSYGNGPTKAWYISMIFYGHFMISPVLSATFHRWFSARFHQWGSIRWGPPKLISVPHFSSITTGQIHAGLVSFSEQKTQLLSVQKCGCHPLPTSNYIT